MMPILHLPGEMMPGQFGPIIRVSRVLRYSFAFDHIRDRDSLGNAYDERQACICGFHDRVCGKRRRHVDHRGVRVRFLSLRQQPC
jgi:hypothetical protein